MGEEVKMTHTLRQLTINKVKLTGTVTGIEKEYSDRQGLLRHKIYVQIRRKDKDGSFVYDDLEVLILFDKHVNEKLNIGDRIRFEGELQRRQVETADHNIPSDVKVAVQNYLEIFDEAPIVVNNQKYRASYLKGQRLDFNRLLETRLLAMIPQDSDVRGEGVSQNGFTKIYMVNQQGIVYKARYQTIYSVMVGSGFEIITPLADYEVDENKVEIRGRILGLNDEKKLPNRNYSIKIMVEVYTQFYDKEIIWRYPVRFMDNQYRSKSKKIKRGDFIHFEGVMNTLKYEVEIQDTYKTPNGKTKLNKRVEEQYYREFYAREILGISKDEEMK